MTTEMINLQHKFWPQHLFSLERIRKLKYANKKYRANKVDGRCPWMAPVELTPSGGRPLHHFAMTNTPPGAAAALPQSGITAGCGGVACGTMEFLRTGTLCPRSRELPQSGWTLRRQGEEQQILSRRTDVIISWRCQWNGAIEFVLTSILLALPSDFNVRVIIDMLT